MGIDHIHGAVQDDGQPGGHTPAGGAGRVLRAKEFRAKGLRAKGFRAKGFRAKVCAEVQ